MECRSWLKEKYNLPNGRYYRQARNILLFEQVSAASSALHLFNKKIQIPEQKLIQNPQKRYDINHQESDIEFVDADLSWTDNVITAVRDLCDLIVTYWLPKGLNVEHPPKTINSMLFNQKQKELIEVPLKFADLANDIMTDAELDFDYSSALSRYEDVFLPLYYHELWHNFVDANNEMSNDLSQHQLSVEFNAIDKNQRVLFGEYLPDYTDDYNPQNRLFSPYDVVILTIEGKQYFGIIVYARHTRFEDNNNQKQQQQQQQSSKSTWS
ncbi:unnamed protein product, partial [Didymodactylos carnosus]